MEQKPCGSCGSSPESIKEKTRAKYDDQWREQGEKAASDRRKNLSMVTDPLISMVHPLTDKVVVDLGIGTGCLAFRALELSPPKMLVGIDFSTAGLCVAQFGLALRQLEQRLRGHLAVARVLVHDALVELDRLR